MVRWLVAGAVGARQGRVLTGVERRGVEATLAVPGRFGEFKDLGRDWGDIRLLGLEADRVH